MRHDSFGNSIHRSNGNFVPRLTPSLLILMHPS